MRHSAKQKALRTDGRTSGQSDFLAYENRATHAEWEKNTLVAFLNLDAQKLVTKVDYLRLEYYFE